MNKTRVIKPKCTRGYYQHSSWDRLLAPFIKPCGFYELTPADESLSIFGIRFQGNKETGENG
jgi:hypothetical protein